jgi:hypothetical protein
MVYETAWDKPVCGEFSLRPAATDVCGGHEPQQRESLTDWFRAFSAEGYVCNQGNVL